MHHTCPKENRKTITAIIGKRLFASSLVLLMGISLSAGKTFGVFSVGEGKYVHFSPGNLQYNAAKGTHQCADGTTQQGTWRFAEHQWDYVGDAELGNVYERGSKCSNALVSATYDGWIDLFGWGTSGWNSGANEYQPWATSDENADYTPGGDENNDLTGSFAFADWSVYNQIGDDAPDTWRTMTKDEWVYLFRERENAEKLFGLGTVNGVPGTIILPDEWVTPTDLTFTPSTEKGFIWQDDTHFSSSNKRYTDNIYTLAQWEHMESAGAVFLPAAGYRHQGSSSNYVTVHGNYWTSTHASVNGSYYLRFAPDYLYTHFYYNRKRGFCVRPVKDSVVVPTYEPKPFSVSADKQVTFSSGNLQYNAAKGTHLCADGTTQQGTWRFAEHQWKFVGDAEVGNVYEDGVKSNNALVSAGYDGWIDIFGWGTSGWNSGAEAYRPYDTSVDNNDYNPGGKANKDITGEYAFADWGIYNQIENAPAGIWRSLTRNEWFYLLCYRTDAKKLFGLGNVEGVNGLILLPDDWTTPPDVTFIPSTERGLVLTEDGYQNSNKDNYSHNPYTFAQWQKMEAAGAVFLPAGGRFGENMTNNPVYGLYWTSTNAGAKYACRAWFDNNSVYPCHGSDRYVRRCVRPVKEITNQEYSVTAAVDDPEHGSVRQSAESVIDGGSVTVEYMPDTYKNMNAVPVPGFYEFVQWNDGDKSNPRVISDVSTTLKLTAITRLKNYVVLRDDMEDEYFDKMAALYYGDAPVSLDSIIYLRDMKADQWQVFNFPFALNTEDSPFDGKVYCYTGSTRNADAGIDLWFSKYSGVLEPGVPYLFYGAAVNRPVFTNMTQTLQLTDAINTPYHTDGQTDESMIRFQGSNRMMLLKGGERNILLLSNSRLYYPNVQGTLLRPFRGYFKVGSAGSAAPRFRIVVEGRTVTELEAVPEDGIMQAENVRKYLEDGQLVIERNGVRYDATGARRE